MIMDVFREQQEQNNSMELKTLKKKKREIIFAESSKETQEPFQTTHMVVCPETSRRRPTM